MKQCPSCGGECGRTKAKGCQQMTKDEALTLALDALMDFDYDKRINAIKVIAESKQDWISLTDPEIEELDMAIDGTVYDFVHAVEDKLREKNK